MEGVKQANFESLKIPVFACKKGDGITWLNSVHDLVWNFWEAICLNTGGKVFEDIPFPIMMPEQELTLEQDIFLPFDSDFWYDDCHPGGFVVGNDIVGPHLFHIRRQLQQNIGFNTKPIRVALLGDSTTSYCTGKYSRLWAVEVANRKAGIKKYFSDNGIDHEDFEPVSYYAIPGTSLDLNPFGFVSQLSAILVDHQVKPFDAILIVGGWNNNTLKEESKNTFVELLEGDSKTLAYWTREDGRPYYDEWLTGYFPKGPYPQP